MCVRAGNESRFGFEIAFYYNQDIVEELKKRIPHTDRVWKPETKTWWVSAKYEHVLKYLFPNFESLIYLQGKLWS